MRKIITATLSALILCGFAACSKSDTNPQDNFDVPQLTADNTIQFTVNANTSRGLEIVLDGGRLAVDWGDGTMTKRYRPSLPGFGHTYKRTGEYTVRVWTEDLTYIMVSGLLRDFRDVQVGDCPVLTSAIFNTISTGTTIDVNRCPKLTMLEVSNCETVQSAYYDQCLQLEELRLYSMPAMTKIDARPNTALSTLFCGWSPLTELLLPGSVEKIRLGDIGLASLDFSGFTNLISLDCYGYAHLTTLNLTGCDNLASLNITETAIATFDFSALPELRTINCDRSKMTAVDVSGNLKLGQLSCTELGLTSLDISQNLGLSKLNCDDNLLTTLNIPANSPLAAISIANNKFEGADLNALFTALPTKLLRESPAQNSFVIIVTGNPGTATCDPRIATNKYWFVKVN